MQRPLADEIRPQTLDDVVGQNHILGKSGLLRRIVESDQIPNMIFYGPSGVGKTTVSHIIAQQTQRSLRKLNATNAGTADVKEIIGDLDTFLAPKGVLLYLDEIQYFNKKQQQSLLEFIENGKITLIASTTENPYFCVFNAILSRSTVFEFKAIPPAEILPAIDRASNMMAARLGKMPRWEDGVKDYIATACGGDVRKAINAVELLFTTANTENASFTMADAKTLTQRSAMRYDRDGDVHYDLLSAFQKSIRGSDPDAAVHYLARLLESGDLLSVCRRLLVTAAEDIGLAYPQAIAIVKACVDSALQIGLPEAGIPLAEAVLLLATAPKSNSAVNAIFAARKDIQEGKFDDIPAHLKDMHYSGAAKLGRGQGYQYPHDFPNHYIRQQYLPEKLRDRVYYEFGENKAEQAAKRYWAAIFENL